MLINICIALGLFNCLYLFFIGVSKIDETSIDQMKINERESEKLFEVDN